MPKAIFKKIAIFSLTALTLFALSGCSLNKPTQSKITLYWWTTRGDASQETLEAIAKDYMSNNKGVNIVVVSKDPRVAEQEALEALAAHQSVENAPDILTVRAENLPWLAPQLVPAPDNLFSSNLKKNQKTGKTTTELVAELFEPAAAKAVTLNDPSGKPKVYGLPMALDSLALYINRDLIDKAVENLRTENRFTQNLSSDELNSIKKKLQTPPATWQQLTEIVPYLTIRNGNDISQSAIALGTSKNIEHSYDILQTLMLQNGTQLTSDDFDSATFNVSQSGATTTVNPGEQALKFYLRFSNPQDPLYSWNDKMPNSVDAFEQGQVAMMIHYADAYRFIIKEAPSLKNSIDVAPLPQIVDPNSTSTTESIKTMAKMWVATVPSAKGDAKRQRAAWDFVYYLGSKQGSATYLSAMKLPSALKDGTDKAKFDAFNIQKQFADIWYKGAKAMSVDEIFISMIDDAANGRKTPKDALDKAAADVTTILKASKTKWGK